MIAARVEAAKFYTFLMACIGTDWDERQAELMPIAMQRDLVRGYFYMWARGEL